MGGGQVALLFSGALIGKLVLDETGALYWTVGTRYGSSPSGTVHRMQDRADTVLATGQTPVSTAIAVDAVHVYFGSDNGASGSIRRVPRKGGSVESVVDCGSHCSPSTLRLDQDNLYFRVLSYGSESGQVQVMSKTDFKIRTIAGSGSATYQYAMDVEVNAGLVYWNWTGVSGPYGIFSAKADGTGFRTIEGSDDAAWYALRVDDAAIYYWHAAAIIRRLK